LAQSPWDIGNYVSGNPPGFNTANHIRRLGARGAVKRLLTFEHGVGIQYMVGAHGVRHTLGKK